MELAVQRALAELDYAPGELGEDEYEVSVLVQPEGGFLGVGGVDALVEVALIADEAGPPQREPEPEDLEEEEDYLDDDMGQREEPDAARLRGFLQTVLDHMGLDAEVRISDKSGLLSAEVVGEDLGIFIGRRGQTIDAVEYLSSIIVFPRPQSRRHVEIDAEGYKERRRRNIERIALRKAQEAARRGKPIQLSPMTPAERKIVHLTLKDRSDVMTASEGREPNRAVVITPSR